MLGFRKGYYGGRDNQRSMISVSKQIFEEMGLKLDAILKEVKTQREIAQLMSYIQLPPPSARMFPSPYQHKEIGAGESAVLLNLDIPGEYICGVITHLGNNWFANTYLTLNVDHQPVIEPKIQRQIAPVTEPTELHRFIARKNIKWTVHNDDTAAHHFEILCNGFFVPRTAASVR